MHFLYNLRLAIILVFVLAFYLSCSKADRVIDQRKENSGQSAVEARFFNQNRTSDPLEGILADYIRRQNNKLHFVEKTVNQIGFPRWDKIVSTTAQKRTTGRQGSDSSLSTYYIPFVRDSQSYVNASMIIKVYPSDTTFSYKCDWQYSQRQNNLNSITDSAEYFAVFFMVLDKAVFGRTEFLVTDTNLFRSSNKNPFTIKLDTLQSGGRNNLMEPVELCQNVTISWQDCPYIPIYGYCFGEGGACDNCTYCTSSLSYNYCWIEWVETGGGGGSGGAGGGGGGTGGGSPPPCGGPIASKSNLYEGCVPGWSPIVGGGNTNPNLLPRYIIPFLTKPCLKTVLTKLSGGGSNTFFKQIYNTFDTSTVNHLTIKEGDLTADSAYGLAYAPVPLPFAGVSFEIKLDTVKLMSCSQEWIAYVFIHEVAHAAMFANIVAWDTANTQHNAMAGQFLALMANSLMAAYPSLPELDAYAMCFTGFFNGMEGSPSPEEIAFSLLIAKKISQKFGVAYSNTQLANLGRQYAETGTKGLRGSCN